MGKEKKKNLRKNVPRRNFVKYVKFDTSLIVFLNKEI